MTAPAPFRTTVRAIAFAGLLCGPAPAALAQAIPTAKPAASGISQEQALSLSARLDALEKRNEELEAQVADLKAQTAGSSKGKLGRIFLLTQWE